MIVMLEIHYSCLSSQCFARRRPLMVPARELDENGAEWVLMVRVLVREDHAYFARRCRCDMFHLLIPRKGRDYFGQATKH
jgi:hypothetical protein